jgi:4-methylaminobutanoate oxidase (formaldehyde-forming)
MYEMVSYGAEAMARVQEESGQEIGWRNVGRVMYTDNEARMETLRAMPETGRVLGIEVETLTPKEVARRLPIIDPTGLVGGAWIPSDARLNPTDLVMAYAKAARRRGVSVRESVAVREISVRNGRVCAVVTDAGTIECDTVVVAAGLWSNEIVATCGLSLPLYALEHQYLITERIPGVDARLPLFLSYDDQLYGREEVGGLIVGSLDDNAIPIRTGEIPGNFSFSLLNERWAQFEPYMSTAMRRFPALRTAGVKLLINGPESFTPDGRMLLGPIPGVQGLFSTCGFNSNGIALSSAAGRYIAEWIVDGAASTDVTALDVRRFSPVQATEAFMRERVTEIPGYLSRLHEPVDDFRTARDIRRSPMHDTLLRAGARFKSVNGWERAAWIGPPSGEPAWMDAVAAEVRAGGRDVLLIDRSADLKLVLRGSHDEAAQCLRCGSLAAAFSARWMPLRGKGGGTEALTRLLPWHDDGVLLTASPDQETRVLEWLRTAGHPMADTSWNATAAFALWELRGPRRHDLLRATHCAPGFHSVSSHLGGDAREPEGRTWIGPIEVHRLEDELLDSTLLVMPADGAACVWERVARAGSDHGLRLGGYFAEEALRVERGVPRFGRELTVGVRLRNAFPERSPTQPRSIDRTLLALSSEARVHGFGSDEAVLEGTRIVGRVSSRVSLPGWPETLFLAVMMAETVGKELEVQVHGRRVPVVVRATQAVERLQRC